MKKNIELEFIAGQLMHNILAVVLLQRLSTDKIK